MNGASRGRLPGLAPADLDAEQRLLYDAILSGPRAGGGQRATIVADDGSLRGPFNAMLLSPPVGTRLQELGSAIRFESVLTAREREIAVLVVAAQWHSDFERASHEPLAAAAGLDDEDVRAIAGGDTPAAADTSERTVTEIARALVRDGRLDDSAYRGAVETLGLGKLFELTTLVGYYSLLALQLRVFWDERTPGGYYDAGE